MNWIIPAHVNDEGVSSWMNNFLVNEQRVEEIAHGVLAGRSNNLTIFWDEDQGEGWRFETVLSVAGAAHLKTLTHLIYCNSHFFVINWGCEWEKLGRVFLVLGSVNGAFCSSYGDRGLFEVGHVILNGNEENTVIFICYFYLSVCLLPNLFLAIIVP